MLSKINIPKTLRYAALFSVLTACTVDPLLEVVDDIVEGEGNRVAVPEFTVGSSQHYHGETISVEINSSTPDATIRYTTDGTDPTATAGEVFAGNTLQISESATYKAIAYRKYWLDSEISRADYTFVDDPLAYVIINFSVDDSANQTYTDGELYWKGSVSYDSATNYIVKDAAWPGPYPLLYDDGPISGGGHEPAGSSAADGIWGIAVYFEVPTTDEAFEYGLEDSTARWVWPNPTNGTFTIPGGSDEGTEFTATGVSFPAFGDIDIKVTLNVAELHTGFLPFDPLFDTITLKNSAAYWEEYQISDWNIGGEDPNPDGVYTFVLSEQIDSEGYTHVGLLDSGEELDFLYVVNFTEYKSAGSPVTDGIAVYTKTGAGAWVAATITPLENWLSVTAP